MSAQILRRLPRNLVMAVLLGYLGYTLASWFLSWNPADGGAYYDAANRLTHGQPLYPPVDPEAHEVFRYAPWFAVAWIPLTLLPRDLALHVWSLAMLACAGAAVWPLLRRASWARMALAALVGQTLAETAMFGNAHPLVVAVLVWTAHRRTFRLGRHRRLDQARAARLRPRLGGAPRVATRGNRRRRGGNPLRADAPLRPERLPP